MVSALRPAESDLQTGGSAASYGIGTAEVKRGSHILLGRRSPNALDRRSHKLLGRRSNTLNNKISHMLLCRGTHTLNYRDATKM